MPTINKNAKKPMINARIRPLFIFKVKKKKKFLGRFR